MPIVSPTSPIAPRGGDDTKQLLPTRQQQPSKQQQQDLFSPTELQSQQKPVSQLAPDARYQQIPTDSRVNLPPLKQQQQVQSNQQQHQVNVLHQQEHRIAPPQPLAPKQLEPSRLSNQQAVEAQPQSDNRNKAAATANLAPDDDAPAAAAAAAPPAKVQYHISPIGPFPKEKLAEASASSQVVSTDAVKSRDAEAEKTEAEAANANPLPHWRFWGAIEGAANALAHFGTGNPAAIVTPASAPAPIGFSLEEVDGHHAEEPEYHNLPDDASLREAAAVHAADAAAAAPERGTSGAGRALEAAISAVARFGGILGIHHPIWF